MARFYYEIVELIIILWLLCLTNAGFVQCFSLCSLQARAHFSNSEFCFPETLNVEVEGKKLTVSRGTSH